MRSLCDAILKLDWTTQAIGQQRTSPLRAGCEARRREIVVICGCGNGLARDAPEASEVDGGLRADGPQGLQAKPGGDTRPRANHRPRVDDGRDPAEVRCLQPLEGVDLEGYALFFFFFSRTARLDVQKTGKTDRQGRSRSFV